MAKRDDVQEERYVTVPWPFFDIHVITALVLPYTSMAKSNDVQSRHAEFISVSKALDPEKSSG